MVSLWLLLFPLLFLPSALYARSSSADDILVIIEPNLPRTKFSIFFENLKGLRTHDRWPLALIPVCLAAQGYNLTFRATNETSPLIVEDDIPQFAHVIFFAPYTKSEHNALGSPTRLANQISTSSEYPADINGQSLIDLLAKSTNILFALSTNKTHWPRSSPSFFHHPAPPSSPISQNGILQRPSFPSTSQNPIRSCRQRLPQSGSLAPLKHCALTPFSSPSCVLPLKAMLPMQPLMTVQTRWWMSRTEVAKASGRAANYPL